MYLSLVKAVVCEVYLFMYTTSLFSHVFVCIFVGRNLKAGVISGVCSLLVNDLLVCLLMVLIWRQLVNSVYTRLSGSVHCDSPTNYDYQCCRRQILCQRNESTA
ncbi:hypothetical protein CHUAL_014194 [Chamberlinius hualienensis]